MTLKSGKIVSFLGFTILFVGLIILSTALDTKYNSNGLISIGVKLLILLFLSYYIKKGNTFLYKENKGNFKYFLIALIPAFFSILGSMTTFDKTIDSGILILGITNLIVSVLFEEVFFQKIGTQIFNEVYSKRGAFAISIIYALTFAVNFIYYDPYVVMIQMIMAFSLRLFLTYIYDKTNLIYTIIGSLCLTLSMYIISAFTSGEVAPYLYKYSTILFVLQVMVPIAIAVIYINVKDRKIKN